MQNPSDLSSPAADRPDAFQNPLEEHGPDPWLTYFEGAYYYASTVDDSIVMRTARKLAGLKSAPGQTVWSDTDPGRGQDFWAPECFLLPNEKGQPRWYLYYTACDGVEPNHRLYVLESSGRTPLGPDTFKAQLLTDPADEFYAIDGSVLQLPDGRLYLFWCGRPAVTGQGLFVSRMTNAWTLEGPRTAIPADGFGCPDIREGPVTLVRNGKAFLVYSTCDARTPNYKLGMLSADVSADLLDLASWHQYPQPVFAALPDHDVWGPGHCFFFKSPDQREDWIIYHAKNHTRWSFEGRSSRAQPFTWQVDGTPDFGVPIPLSRRLAPPSGE